MKPLAEYFAASRTELSKVTWPTRRQTVRWTIVVIIFSFIMAGVLGVLDFIFSTIVQKLIIKG